MGSHTVQEKGDLGVVDPKRSALMSRVRQKDTAPEIVVRKYIHKIGYRFRLHRRDLPGTPDIVLPKYRKVVFVHGCFWHGHEGCPRGKMPKTRSEFWTKKIASNKKRDSVAKARLRNTGWDVLEIWECETKSEEVYGPKLTAFLAAV